ncbi:MAG: ABC transporter permease [Treponema sp.]|nr:ABC transporter permease [Treponema sp.]
MTDDSVRTVSADSSFFDFKLGELLRYRDLIFMLVKRSYVTRYKQTLLGSAWLVITPVCSVIMNVMLFGMIAGLSTDGIPKPLFYFLNNILWAFFSGCLFDSAGTFTGNAGLFGKVYFPRLVIPVASATTQFLDFCIKFCLFLILMLGYYLFAGYRITFGVSVLLLPVTLFQFFLLGTGFGIIISAFTVKYRDLQVFVPFGMQVWMYLTPVVYTVSDVPERYRFMYSLNPLYPGFVMFRSALFGTGTTSARLWTASIIFSFAVFLSGILVFNRVERTFVDTV